MSRETRTTVLVLPDRASGRASGSDMTREIGRPDPEVIAKPERRRFSAEYKLRILEEIDQAGPGETGKILRREGLYSSLLTEWRRSRKAGAMGALSRTRGRKRKPENPLEQRVRQLERELAKAQEDLRKAHIILDVQEKVSKLLGIDLKSEKDS